jgi:hypothetical protein
MFVKLLRVLPILMLFSGAVLAEDYYVNITNKTGYSIDHMYISPGSAKKWQEDVLGEDTLENGQTVRVNLGNYSKPIFDIRLVDEEGDKYTFWDFNVEEYDLEVTSDDIDD